MDPSKNALDSPATTFSNVSYLGSSTVADPTNEAEVSQIISQLNEELRSGAMNVKVAVPTYFTGQIGLIDGDTEQVIRTFNVAQIRCCTCGLRGTKQQECIAFSFTQNFGKKDASHQCHVFRCQSAQVVGHMLQCFQRVFESKNPTAPGVSFEEEHEFDMFLEIKEEDDNGSGFTFCPVETNCFKFRKDRKRKFVAVIKQTKGPRDLCIRKCFGFLLAAGRYLRESDMQLLDSQESQQLDNNTVFQIEAPWNPRARNFEVLNIETPKETRAFMTVAVDVIFDGVDESVRYSMECRARVVHQMESFPFSQRVPVVEHFFMKLMVVDGKSKITSFESAAQRERSQGLANGKSLEKMPIQLIHPTNDDESDSDEPLLSGSGVVNRAISDETFKEWNEMVAGWELKPQERPQVLSELMMANGGIPDVLREKVWPLLSKAILDVELEQTYHMLLEKESVAEQVIMRDIHRTFPAHDYFKKADGEGQSRLYKLSKAYSLYDEEVGYCQGLSFLAAALLLHMSEEKSFCVLVRIMYNYELRDLFKLGFDALHLRFYQLQKLIEDYIPDLYRHFTDNNVETHMYASQWFLTLFTAKFPLQMVFYIIDLFLAEGINTIFHVAVALLQDTKMDLLRLDFEGILKYFRVTLPRRYRSEAVAKELIAKAVNLKISHKKLTKYEKMFREAKQNELETLDPKDRLEREVATLKNTVMRLERENDDLARELVTSKIDLRNRLDSAEDKLEQAVIANQRKAKECNDLQDEISVLREQSVLLKETCTNEMDRLQAVLTRYETVCSFFESDRNECRKKIESLQKTISSCPKCNNEISTVDELFKAVSLDRDVPVLDKLISNGKSNGKKSNSERTSDGAYGEKSINYLMDLVAEYEKSLKHVESELVETKLALVEAQCQNQGLVHQMSSRNQNSSDSAWLKKTLSSIKEVGMSIKNNGAQPE
ncbi:unnamed protein product [Bursaphelenchus xylophilus]|uniref:(pine wood nematode) hypothetical protein n=1 Tax=Bursaphelenchus xylophilus TaxID=6326 RepID=A0A1I7SM86_BURXY|nr:unnamed protein product [Bursaphelenchus xylophilus]CAG9130044.1 unnamed protein product [Bursaphelenchus xylophilus]